MPLVFFVSRVLGDPASLMAHRIQIGEADVIGPARDLRDRVARTGATVDGHVEMQFLVGAVVKREREHRLLALKCPVQDEADFRVLGLGSTGHKRDAEKGKGGDSPTGAVQHLKGTFRFEGSRYALQD